MRATPCQSFGRAYRYRSDLDEDAQEFIETLERWKAVELKRRQLLRLIRICRNSESIPWDTLDEQSERAALDEVA